MALSDYIIEAFKALGGSRSIREIEDIDGVKQVTQENGHLYVYAKDECDYNVSRTIVDNGSTILMMKPREYTLEEIFMKYYEEGA